MKQRIVLAYDGSPEGSNAIAWLAREHDADVVTLTLDLGGGAALNGVRDLSLGRGAIRAHVLEVQEEFAREIIIPAAQAGTCGPSTPIAALVRPLLAKKLVDVARIEKATAVAYVSREDEAGPDGLIASIDPTIPVIATEAGRHLPQVVPVRKPTSTASVITTPAHVDISFKDGMPTAINGIGMRLPELLESLATIAVEHGIPTGEHAFVPAAAVLHDGYRALVPARDGIVRLKLSHGECTVCEPVKIKS
jgi:argininosuccinate synthase